MARPKKINQKTIKRILEYFQDSYTIREVFNQSDIDITWQTFRSALIKSDELMNQYLKSRQIAQDYKLDELSDKRKELEQKIEDLTRIMLKDIKITKDEIDYATNKVLKGADRARVAHDSISKGVEEMYR